MSSLHERDLSEGDGWMLEARQLFNQMQEVSPGLSSAVVRAVVNVEPVAVHSLIELVN